MLRHLLRGMEQPWVYPVCEDVGSSDQYQYKRQKGENGDVVGNTVLQLRNNRSERLVVLA